MRLSRNAFTCLKETLARVLLGHYKTVAIFDLDLQRSQYKPTYQISCTLKAFKYLTKHNLLGLVHLNLNIVHASKLSRTPGLVDIGLVTYRSVRVL